MPEPEATYRLGVDIGGTFTDVVLLGRYGVVLTAEPVAVDHERTALARGG